jgi:hypothetical protein
LHAALLDSRIQRVVVQDTLGLFRMGVEGEYHRIIYEVAVPGALRSYDLDDIEAALQSRMVAVLNPVDQMGNPVELEALRKEMGPAASRINLASRGPQDSLAGYFSGAR